MSAGAEQGAAGYLSGMSVLDLGQLHPGPYTAMLLGQLGATVIKVEKPQGDTARQLGAETFAKYNRGKQSICLDLKREEDKRVLLQLVAGSDVVVEGFRPGVMANLGLDYTQLARVNPRVVLCSISGFGQTGPYAQRPGHDVNYMALAGYWAVPSQVRDVMARPRLRLSDYCAAMHAALAILAAVQDARESGVGQHLDVSIHDTMTAWMAPALQAMNGPAGPEVAHLPHVMPDNDVFETADGRHLALGILEESFWRNLCVALAPVCPDLNAPGYQTRAGRMREKRVLNDRLRELFKSRSLADWERLFDGHDIPWAPVLRHDEVFEDPHVRHRGVVADTPAGRVVGFPVKFSKPLPSMAREVPGLDQHRAQILARLRAQAS
ncbi:CoA transferase [Achromobacter sp. ACM04]|uniref:CaiB/BaiF CoA transferase family protein n=1 Tax=Achromobacter TaxID=222 RepID=UPI001467D595|nr:MULTISPECIES: CoA transferase [Achromobacter]MBD9421192.1 CoA transferase [Achromobacter sp. ACM04]MBD9431703.1 CoA transferase [Achromobacter sp. ACM03]MBD9474906.1 CoA transferase [Achromobacter sp. ACM01]CAB3646218.1 Acetyl-CoA:oxalate CoA-transferase [Achromobacter aegrifaciens]